MIIVGETLLRITMSTNSLVTVSLRNFKYNQDKDSKLPSKKMKQQHEKTIKELIDKLAAWELHIDEDISMLIDFIGVYLACLLSHQKNLYVCEVIQCYLTLLINTIEKMIDKGKVLTTSADIETVVNALNELHADAYYLRARVYQQIINWTKSGDYMPIIRDFLCAIHLGNRAAEDDFRVFKAQQKSLQYKSSVTAVSLLRMPDKNEKSEQKIIELKTLTI